MNKTLLLIIVLLLGLTTSAQTSELTMRLSKETVVVGERFELIISLEGSTSPIVPPKLEGLRSVSPPVRGQEYKDLFGKRSITTSLTYVLQADKAGNYTIGSAESRTAKGRIRSNTVALEVLERSATATPGQNEEATLTVSMPNGFKLMAFASKKEAVVGEPILISYILYTNQNNIELSQYGNPPQHKGFISNNTMLDGARWELAPDRTYKKLHLSDQILVPLESGDFVLEPYEITVARARFFSGDRYIAASDPLRVKIAPLPPGSSSAFKGAVGKLEIRANLSANKVETNSPVHLQVFISGTGNLESLAPPVLSLSDDLEAYDPEISDRISTASGTISGRRTFDYLVIPRKAGKHRIDPIEFEFYDTELKRYVKRTTKPFTILSEGDGTTAVIERPGGVMPATKSEDEVVDESASSSFLSAKNIAFFVGVPALAFLLFLGYKKAKGNSQSKAERKAKQADQIAERILKEARAQKDAGNNSGFYSSLYQAMNRYVEQKLNIPTAEMGRKRVTAALIKQSVDEQTITTWNRALDQCEQAAYSRVGVADPESLYREVSGLVKELEKEL